MYDIFLMHDPPFLMHKKLDIFVMMDDHANAPPALIIILAVFVVLKKKKEKKKKSMKRVNICKSID